MSRRPTTVTTLVVAVILTLAASPAVGQEQTGHSAVEQQIAWETFTWINDERQARGLPPVEWSVEHAAGAAEWSRWMAENQQQVHAPAEDQHVDGFNGWGENIYRLSWQRGLPAGTAHVGFMNSDGHRDNILAAGWEVVGVGIACVDGYLHVTHRFGNQASDPWEGVPETDPDPVVHDDTQAGTGCLDAVEDPPEPSPVWGDDSPAPPDDGPEQPAGPPQGRIGDLNPAARSVSVAQARWPDRDLRQGQPAPRHVVLARDDEVADSLAASVFTGDGALLLTGRDQLDDKTGLELDRLLPAGGVVYLMGGTAALSDAVEDAVVAAGHTVVRVAGATRIATAVAAADIARPLYGNMPMVMVARAYGAGDDPTAGWADAIAGGLVAAEQHRPILLTPSGQLDRDVAAWLDRHQISGATVLGGTAAISTQAESDLAGHVQWVNRLGGASRDATAAHINDTLPSNRYGGVLVSYDGYSAGGWVDGLLAAGLAADHDGRTLMVAADSLPIRTRELVDRHGCDRHITIGTTITELVVEEIDRAC